MNTSPSSPQSPTYTTAQEQYEISSLERARPQQGARIESVCVNSPAYREGLREGMVLTALNGEAFGDMIDWLWHASENTIEIEGIAEPDTKDAWEFEAVLTREPGEDWGIEFDGVVFDGLRTCRNRCIFCFMAMLPKDMRGSLYLRDDDYRLSFLQGNFVTFTNMTAEDVNRVIERHLSPLNMSIHAITPQVRHRLIGKHHARGIEVLEQLLEAGIEIHAQIVLLPDENDGEELERTLTYIREHPGITSVGIVPLGFTKFQKRFSSSFDTPKKAQAVIDCVHTFQEQSRIQDGFTRYHLADEFYLWAHSAPPCADFYDGFPQYYDGIGMYRVYLDEFNRVAQDDAHLLEEIAFRLKSRSAQLTFMTGEAFAPVLRELMETSPFGTQTEILAVQNRFFGGNVDVTGLLTAPDILRTFNEHMSRFEGLTPRIPLSLTSDSSYHRWKHLPITTRLLILPQVIFNEDKLLLDGMTQADLIKALKQRGATEVVVASTQFDTMCRQILSALEQL